MNAEIYTQHGFATRREYLENLAEDYGVDPAKVLALATLLGPGEDFNGLVSAVQDMTEEEAGE